MMFKKICHRLSDQTTTNNDTPNTVELPAQDRDETVLESEIPSGEEEKNEPPAKRRKFELDPENLEES